MEPYQPVTAKELAEALAEAGRQRRQIHLGGAFSKQRMRAPAPDDAAVISTANLSGIVEYESRDLTISVRAGTPFAEVAATIAADGLMLPLDPPCFTKATIGGVVAVNTAGPRRRLYGAARDQVIGMTFATVSGKIAHTGGMVVKNTAGFEMGKLMVGSLGTLGAITSVNFRLAPMPPATRTFIMTRDSLDAAIAARNELLRGVLQPAAVDLLNPSGSRHVGIGGFSLVVQAGGNRAVLDRYNRELPGARAIDGREENELWERIREFTPRFLDGHPERAMVRISSTVSGIGGILGGIPGPALARAGTGTIYAGFDDTEAACRWAADVAGNGVRAVVEHISADGCTGERWPLPGPDLAMMERLKRMFDPNHLLNRGALYGRL
jgi:glycolate oxidase FAD binding subunit